MSDFIDTIQRLGGLAQERIAEIDAEMTDLRNERARIIRMFGPHDGRVNGPRRRDGMWPEQILAVMPEGEPMRGRDILAAVASADGDTDALQRIRQTVYAALVRMTNDGTLERVGHGVYLLPSGRRA